MTQRLVKPAPGRGPRMTVAGRALRLNVTGLACVRGGRTVFEGLGFELAAGRGMSLEGPNGAGKSTLLRAVAGLLRPAAGTIRLGGGPDDLPVAEQCHLVGHLNSIKRAFTVAENARFWGDYLGGAGGDESALERVGLGALADIPAGLLSAGQARRLALARLLAAPRPLWLLDEPSVSLDEAGRLLLAGLIDAHLDTGGLVVAATHAPLGARLGERLTLGGRGRP